MYRYYTSGSTKFIIHYQFEFHVPCDAVTLAVILVAKHSAANNTHAVPRLKSQGP